MLQELPKKVEDYLEKIQNALMPSNEGFVVFKANYPIFDDNSDKIPIESLKSVSDYEILTVNGNDYIVPWLIIKENETISNIHGDFKKRIINYLKSGKKLSFESSKSEISINGQTKIEIDINNYSTFEKGFSITSTLSGDVSFYKTLANFVKITDEEGKIVGKINILARPNILKTITKKLVYLNTGNGTAKSKFSKQFIINAFKPHNDVFVEWQIEDEIELDISKIYNSTYKNKKEFQMNDFKTMFEASSEKYLANGLIIISNMESSRIIDGSTGLIGLINGFAQRNGNLVIFNSANASTFIHEGGHVLGLPHTFCCKISGEKDSYCENEVGNRCLDKSSTLNFMDYSEGYDFRDHFLFYQWKILNQY